VQTAEKGNKKKGGKGNLFQKKGPSRKMGEGLESGKGASTFPPKAVGKKKRSGVPAKDHELKKSPPLLYPTGEPGIRTSSFFKKKKFRRIAFLPAGDKTFEKKIWEQKPGGRKKVRSRSRGANLTPQGETLNVPVLTGNRGIKSGGGNE